MRTHRGPTGRIRRGLAYLEVVAASFVFALTLAGLGASLAAQERLMGAIEQRAYVLARPDHRIQLDRVEDDPSPGGFWAVAKLRATPLTPVPEAEIGSIEARAYGLMGALGPVPSILEVVDRRPDRWPDDGRIVPAPTAVAPDGLTSHPRAPVASVSVVTPLEESGSPAEACVLVDWIRLPASDGGGGG